MCFFLISFLGMDLLLIYSKDNFFNLAFPLLEKYFIFEKCLFSASGTKGERLGHGVLMKKCVIRLKSRE